MATFSAVMVLGTPEVRGSAEPLICFLFGQSSSLTNPPSSIGYAVA